MSFYKPMNIVQACDYAFVQKLELIEFFNGGGKSHFRFVWLDQDADDEPGVWRKTSKVVSKRVMAELKLKPTEANGRVFRF